jgi:starch synthase (maltosyl-transferring)
MAKSMRPDAGATSRPTGVAAPTVEADSAPSLTGPDGVGDVSRSSVPVDALVTGLPPRGLGRIPITKVSPVVEGGAYPAKAVVGELIPVTARVFREGHDAVAANVVLTSPDGTETSTRMTQVEPWGLDIWEAWVRPDAEGDWTFRVEAWSDPWATWLHNAEAKLPIAQDVPLVCLEVQRVLGRGEAQATQDEAPVDAALLKATAMLIPARDPQELLETLRQSGVRRAMVAHPPRDYVTRTSEFPLRVDRERALFSSWYEFFPRSQGAHQDGDSWVSGTFDSSHERLEAAAAMGFDIVYVPPIHPIGVSHRKGRNNTLTPAPSDPGSPWAIGNADGGHDAINPDLGDMAAFERFVAKAKELGLEVALDFALQASPDHPWVTEHPEWFTTRLDGTIAYAENPPKKYQDIYPINFDTDPAGIYAESLRLLRFWADKGVTVFRVDNPHTKPVQFWGWVMRKMRESHPHVVFLAEAFTRPEMMHALGKVGFHESYTYFTWRNTKEELEEYLHELSGDMAPFYRPSFWVNTPDINPAFLQSGLPSAFAIRAVLAATMSPSWGVYSGFELYEHEPLRAGGEEYLNSEKFEYRPRNFQTPGNLSMLIGTLNAIRHRHQALHGLRTIRFHPTNNSEIIAFTKADGDDRVLVVCSLNPHVTVAGEVFLDLAALDLPLEGLIRVNDEITGASFTWGSTGFVRLDPSNPAHVASIGPA